MSKLHQCHDNDESNYVDEDEDDDDDDNDDDEEEEDDDDDLFTRSLYACLLAVSPIVTHFWYRHCKSMWFANTHRWRAALTSFSIYSKM